MKRVVLFAAVLLALGASGAQAAHRVHLRAAGAQRVWRSPQAVPATTEVSYAVYVNGREIDARHRIAGYCRAAFQTKRLAVQTESCGTSPLTLRYLGSTRFTLVYWF